MSYTTMTLPVDEIQSHPENDFTMDERELQELVDSIRSEGLGQLPLVRQLPDGDSRRIGGSRARTRRSPAFPSRSSTTSTMLALACCSMSPTS